MKYQIISRKYRPQKFQDVIGQENLVSTLKNAIKHSRVAHAYLFCGTRGTGKTTLARLFSKALNCSNLTSDTEPCNTCCSCQEIMQGASLDFLEIDGASNRGIDDIRHLNETVGYAPSTASSYKIYLIDEVHMLTKEAFNALLKTLEEPPSNVVFFFATTEPHKVPATILSRCQRFNLQRLSEELIQTKLQNIAQDQSISVDSEALRKIAKAADGSLRDAESLFDQILAYSDGPIKESDVVEMLGLMPNDTFLALDQAIYQNNQAFAFEVAHQVVQSGKDIMHFIESLVEHYRYLLLINLAGPANPHLDNLDKKFLDQLVINAKKFTKDQCVEFIDILVTAQQELKIIKQTSLEALLLRLIASYKKISIEKLVDRLLSLEEKLNDDSKIALPSEQPNIVKKIIEKQVEKVVSSPKPICDTPLVAEKPNSAHANKHHPSRYDTIMRFAAVELEGTVKIPKKR